MATTNHKLRSWEDEARTVLGLDEGLSLTPYKDTKGNWTIGVGYLIGKELTDLKLSLPVVYAMLSEKMCEAMADLHSVFGGAFNSFERGRQLALLSMMYSLGRTRFLGFVKMIAAVKAGDWKQAAIESLDSKWARDVDPRQRPGVGRDDRVAFMLRTGEVHPEYLD